MRNVAEARTILASWKGRRGRPTGFHREDSFDLGSSLGNLPATPCGRPPGTGDRLIATSRPSKTYGVGQGFWTLDGTIGLVTFNRDHFPAHAVLLTAGFRSDVSARFGTDHLAADLRIRTDLRILNRFVWAWTGCRRTV